MLVFLKNIIRLIKISRTLARHDALFPLNWVSSTSGLVLTAKILSGFRIKSSVRSQRPGARLAIALQELGPSFIKFGQMLSTRPDLVGELIANDLSILQDNLPSFSAKDARATIETQLDATIDELFDDFEDKPIAAASIAQVHFAITKLTPHEIETAKKNNLPYTGRNVAVKVLRPGIEKAFASDIELFHWIAKLLEAFQPQLRRLKPVAIIETFSESVHWELDLRLESSAAAELAENFSNDPLYLVPAVDWTRTSQRVLTTERIDGIPIHNFKELREAGHDLENIVKRASENFFLQVFRDGYFHADMHPGNAFVLDDGTLAVVDFGIMGRIDKNTRFYLADMLLGFVTGDYNRVAEVHFRAGYVPADKDKQAFKQAVRAVGEPIFGQSSSEISIARLLSQLFQVTKEFNMETQPQLLLLQKTMLLAEGVGRQLAPNTNMWKLAEPLIEEWMIENRGPEARLAEVITNVIWAAERLPTAITELEKKLYQTNDSSSKKNVKSNQKHLVQWPIWLAISLLTILFLTKI
jgi:ubiquinone biosynthesis protein